MPELQPAKKGLKALLAKDEVKPPPAEEREVK